MDSSPATLFHISDLHFSHEDRAALDGLMAAIERECPAAVICTGDVTMRGTPREFALAREWLGALPVPLTLEPGNHDLPYYWYPLARALHPWREYRALEAAVERPPTLPQLAIVPLRTVAAAQWRLNWSKGRVAGADLDQAINALERHRDRPLRLVTCHHPLVDADTASSGSTRGGRAALAALARAGASAVLSGHVHDPFDLTIEAEPGWPIRLIGAGTLSQRLRSSPPSYNRLDIGGDGSLKVAIETLG